MNDEDRGAVRLGELAERFRARRLAGEALSVSAFAAEHPADAPHIAALFPTLALLDEHAPLVAEALAGPDPDPEAAEDAVEPPRELGPYQILREIGRGGMGVVYEAHDRALDRRVAVKVLPGWPPRDPRARERFRREARIVGRLKHPGIVPVHALDECDGVAYFVMDLIDGVGLDRIVGDVPPGDSRARWVARIGLQAAEALAFAHGEGVLHRDVKPSNFLLDGEGRLWLADFGLARLAGDGGLTASGEWLGTLRYTAPECLRGEADARSDLYSLGLTLYELLLGTPAYPETDRVRLVHQVIEGAYPPPRRLDPTVPRDLEAILLRCAAPEPGGRYPDAIALAADLRRYLDGRPVAARAGGRRRRLARWLALPLVAVVLLALAGLRSRARPAPAAVAAPGAGEAIGPGHPQGPPPWAGWRRGLGGGGGGGRGFGFGPAGGRRPPE
jgi:predicted Ser/Thr protein kinase